MHFIKGGIFMQVCRMSNFLCLLLGYLTAADKIGEMGFPLINTEFPGKNIPLEKAGKDGFKMFSAIGFPSKFVDENRFDAFDMVRNIIQQPEYFNIAGFDLLSQFIIY